MKLIAQSLTPISTLALLAIALPLGINAAEPIIPPKPQPAATTLEPKDRKALRNTTGITKNPLRYDLAERLEKIEKLGGNLETEEAVRRSLDWFTRTQKPLGYWEETKSPIAHTGLALLCYMSYGAKHNEEGPHQEPLLRGLSWLVDQVKEDGAMFDGGQMYAQCIGTIAICEALGLSKDKKLESAAKRALDFIVKAQNPDTGGWRYFPYKYSQDTGDLSVTGWAVMALRSADMAGLRPPTESFNSAKNFLDTLSAGNDAGLYGYRTPSPSPAMTAEGMFCQQVFGRKAVLDRMKESTSFLATHSPRAEQNNYYYWYYGTLAMNLNGGQAWTDWNDRMRPILLSKQAKQGDNAGSWEAVGHRSKVEGRTVTTAWATLSLSVYYRYLPILNGYERSNLRGATGTIPKDN